MLYLNSCKSPLDPCEIVQNKAHYIDNYVCFDQKGYTVLLMFHFLYQYMPAFSRNRTQKSIHMHTYHYHHKTSCLIYTNLFSEKDLKKNEE